MGGEHGVKDVKELFDLGFALVQAGKGAMADGEVTLADLSQLMVVYPSIGPAFEGIKNVPLELGELDSGDTQALLEHAAQKMGMVTEDPALVKKVVACVKVALAVGEALEAFEVV